MTNEQEEDKVISEARRQIDLEDGMMRYSHRNGEMEPPTVEGYYWYDEDDDTPRPQNDYLGMVYVLDGDAIAAFGHYRPLSALPGRWWGPVTPQRPYNA